MINSKNIVRVWINHPYDNGNFNGTAFFIDESTLLTAKHVVVDGYDSIYKKIYLSDTPNGGIVPISEILLCERDIAILKIKNKFKIDKIYFTDNLNIGDMVKIIGFHDKNGARNSKEHNVSGYLNDIHTYELQNHLSGGLSGSPIFMDNKICGITQAVNNRKNITYIIPIEESCSNIVKNALEKFQKKYNVMPTNSFKLEYPVGIVPLNSNYYLEREDDKKCYQNLLEQYSLLHIKAPIQYGKTSLLSRLIAKAKEKEYYVVFLEFQKFDKLLLKDLKELLEYISDIIFDTLDVKVELNQRIMQRLAPKDRVTRLMEKILLKIDKPLVLIIDETNKLFEYSEVSNDFFGLIRAWHENAKIDNSWEKLKIVLAHSIDPLLGVEDINQSPFHNVGLAIELRAFTKKEVEVLSIKHGIDLKNEELERLMKFIGGHPFLTRKVLFHIAKNGVTLNDIIKKSYGKDTIFDDFKMYLHIIQENEALMLTLKKILRGENCGDYISCYILESMGIIRYNLNRPKFSCELYQEFFSRRL